MTIADLKVDEKAEIVGIDAGKEFKRRLNSFGIVKGTEFVLKAKTLTANTFEIEVNRNMIALRRGEAQKIKVSPCKR